MQLSLKQTWFAGGQIHIMLFLAIRVMIWKKKFFFNKSSEYNQSFEVFVPCISPHVCTQLKLKQLTQYPLYLWKKKRKWTDISIFASPDILFNFCFANLAADIKSTPAVAKIRLLQQKYTTAKI